MTLTPEDVKTIIENPIEAVDLANLIYVSESNLSIQRKKVGKGFTYHENGEKVNDAETLKRIKALVIPPGWRNVHISKFDKGHLQAVGRDEKERKQYIYHQSWSKIRNHWSKYCKIINQPG